MSSSNLVPENPSCKFLAMGGGNPIIRIVVAAQGKASASIEEKGAQFQFRGVYKA